MIGAENIADEVVSEFKIFLCVFSGIVEENTRDAVVSVGGLEFLIFSGDRSIKIN